MFTVIALIVGLGLGFAAGRVKDAAKLAAIQAELTKVDVAASAEVNALVAKIIAKL